VILPLSTPSCETGFGGPNPNHLKPFVGWRDNPAQIAAFQDIPGLVIAPVKLYWAPCAATDRRNEACRSQKPSPHSPCKQLAVFGRVTDLYRKFTRLAGFLATACDRRFPKGSQAFRGFHGSPSETLIANWTKAKGCPFLSSCTPAARVLISSSTITASSHRYIFKLGEGADIGLDAQIRAEVTSGLFLERRRNVVNSRRPLGWFQRLREVVI